MTRRRVIGGVVLLAVVALAIWVSRNVYWAEVQVPTPLRGEAAVNPFYATERVVRQLGASATWDRVLSLPRADGVLILSDWRWSLSETRAQRVQAWVEQGGRLIADQGVASDPAFRQWAGVGMRDLRGQAIREARRRQAGGCLAITPSGTGADAARGFTLCGARPDTIFDAPMTTEFALGDTLGAQVVRVRVGRGVVTVINASPFRERQIFLGDHAALLVTAAQLRRGDDVHLLAESEFPSILALAWMRGWPVVVLLLVCLCGWVWRVATRFGPALGAEATARRSLEEQIRGTGDFTRRYGAGHPLLAATRRALEERAVRTITGYARMSGDGQIAALAAATGVAPDAIASALVAESSQSQQFGEALRTLETVRRSLHSRRTRT